MAALIFTMSVGIAHADPGFVIAESQVRAGDTVHFSIAGGDGRVTYEIEVGDRDVAKGSGERGAASGQFTIPDFGSTAKTLKVEADIRDSDDETEVERKLQYLGAALPAPAPAAAPPAVPHQIATAPPTGPAPAAAAAPAAEVPVAKDRSKSTPRKHTRKRHKVKRRKVKRQAVSRRSREHKREEPVTKKRARGPAPRTAPLFNGVPEPGSENFSPEDQESSEPKKRAARTPVFASTVASRSNGEPAVAIILPGLLGLAGLVLAAATVARRRRNR